MCSRANAKWRRTTRSLGRFDLQGIPPAPRGVPQIEVTFDIDANGIVSVTAKDKATSKEQQIRIQARGGLSDADIQKMVKDAEAHAAEDKKRRELVEAKNQADALIHSTEKAMGEHGDKVGPDEKTAIEAATAALKEAIKGDDAEDIKAKTNTLAQASMKLGEAMYKAQQAEGAAADAAADGAGNKPDDNVVDADFEEVDDKKKGVTLQDWPASFARSAARGRWPHRLGAKAGGAREVEFWGHEALLLRDPGMPEGRHGRHSEVRLSQAGDEIPSRQESRRPHRRSQIQGNQRGL